MRLIKFFSAEIAALLCALWFWKGGLATNLGDGHLPSYDWPAFTNWDCVGLNDTVDWDGLHIELRKYAALVEINETQPRALINVAPQASKLQDAAAAAQEECPLGFLYVMVLRSIQTMQELRAGSVASVSTSLAVGTDRMEMQLQILQEELTRYPFFILASARWPIYQVFDVHHEILMPQSEESLRTIECPTSGPSGVNWEALRKAAWTWISDQLIGLEAGEGAIEGPLHIKDVATAVYQNSQTGDLAQQECPLGFLFLCAVQALSAAVRLTEAFDVWAKAVDTIMGQVPFWAVAGSQWPTYRLFIMLSAFAQGETNRSVGYQQDIQRWGGWHPVAKRFRSFSDLRLGSRELAPLGMDEEAWKQVDLLASTSALSWCEWISPLLSQNPSLRPVFQRLLSAVTSVLQQAETKHAVECGFSGITKSACEHRGCTFADPDQSGGAMDVRRGVSSSTPSAAEMPWCRLPSASRKLVLVTFVWGKQWAPLVSRFVAWMLSLRLRVIIVAMGRACAKACEAASLIAASAPGGSVACWVPWLPDEGSDAESDQDGGTERTGSILQRHAIMHVLLHLGIDVLAFDFDTFLFRDPTRRLEEIAEESKADILMTRHLDAECLNMGLIYIRASASTAKWYHRYLAWLHLHTYEREQRGINALLQYTSQKVSFQPSSKELPAVRAEALDDSNEFASSRGGWLGNWSALTFFHWVNPMVTQVRWAKWKLQAIREIYDAVLSVPALRVSAATSRGGLLPGLLANEARDGVSNGQSHQHGPLSIIVKIMSEMMISEAPPRDVCW